MINFEVRELWHGIIVEEVGMYLLPGMNLSDADARRLIIRRSLQAHSDFIMRLARRGWAPVFQLFPELTLVLVQIAKKRL